MNTLYDSMMQNADPTQVAGLSCFFKTGPGQYAEGDCFLGIKVPVTRSVVKSCWQQTTLADLQQCVTSPYHEIRLAALLALIQHYRHAKHSEEQQRRYVDFYLSNLTYVNNWDLVDLSCYELLGNWLLNRDRQLLYHLAQHGTTIWQQRIGIVSTMTFIRHNQTDDTYAIADLYLQKEPPLHDLLQKAAGWLLREAGKRNPDQLLAWLEPRRQSMPRTMLRYAIEKFPPATRKQLLART